MEKTPLYNDTEKFIFRVQESPGRARDRLELTCFAAPAREKIARARSSVKSSRESGARKNIGTRSIGAHKCLSTGRSPTYARAKASSRAFCACVSEGLRCRTGGERAMRRHWRFQSGESEGLRNYCRGHARVGEGLTKSSGVFLSKLQKGILGNV